jgi:hypothetical protein
MPEVKTLDAARAARSVAQKRQRISQSRRDARACEAATSLDPHLHSAVLRAGGLCREAAAVGLASRQRDHTLGRHVPRAGGGGTAQ